MTSLLFVQLALAAPITDAPLVSAVSLPPTGVAAISVPVEMRIRAESAEDFVLLDANDREVPFIWVYNAQRRSLATHVEPTIDRDAYEVSVVEPVDGLTLDLPTGSRATVTVTTRDGRVLASRFVWSLPQSRALDVPLPEAAAGPFRVRFSWTGEPPGVSPNVSAWIQDLRLDTERVPVTVGPPTVDARGTTWWEVVSPRSYGAADTQLRLELDAETFDRVAVVTEGDADGARIGGGQVFRSAAGTQVTVSVDNPQRQMALGLEATRDPMPTLRGVAIEFGETRLLLRDAGPGPHQLFGGRHRAIQSEVYDLEVDRLALLRARPTPVQAESPQPNPAYVPPEVAANLIAPGQSLPLPKWRWKRTLQGQGLVEIELPAEIAARAREDLVDVRVIDADGLELPRIVTSPASQFTWTVVTPTRREDGSRSILEFKLPESDVPVSAVRIRSEATVFSRDVTLLRGGLGGVLAASWWNGDPRGSTLEMTVGKRVGDTLQLVIDNGSDAPLPVSEVVVATPRWSLTTFVPPSGATLVYGNPLAADPAFDLFALMDELRDRGPTPATLGEPVAIERPPLPVWDTTLLIAGLIVASGALLMVTLRAALAAPSEPAEPPATEGSR